MGDSISEGTIVQWTKAEGDSVAQDEVLVVLETDKVSIDVRAPEAGKLTAQLAAEGDTVQVGAPLAKLDLSGGGSSGGSKEEAPKKDKPAPAKKEQPLPAKKESPPKQQEEKTPAKSAAPAPAPAASAPAPGQKVEMPPIQASSPHDR
jgi:pyruvate/2-oxoglutarate dehydrogenase complex dihydrolipoamide acyltransferase (E2) component